MIEITATEQQRIADSLRQADEAIERVATTFAAEIRPVIQAMAHELEPLVADLRRTFVAANVMQAQHLIALLPAERD
jgi:restriction endonuclease S subunit